jgi:hypothetical protein
MSEADLRLNISTKTPREEWVERFRRVVEYFEATEDLESFESGHPYPIEADPYVLHASHKAPLRPGAETEHNWYILLNPWSSPASRTAWITDGRPLLPKETAHGAPEGGIVANDRDLEEVHAHRVVVCVALTKVAGMHSRHETWIHCDEEIEAQFDNVLDALEEEADDARE